MCWCSFANTDSVLLWLISFGFYPYSSGLLHGHRGNHNDCPSALQQAWRISMGKYTQSVCTENCGCSWSTKNHFCIYRTKISLACKPISTSPYWNLLTPGIELVAHHVNCSICLPGPTGPTTWLAYQYQFMSSIFFQKLLFPCWISPEIYRHVVKKIKCRSCVNSPDSGDWILWLWGGQYHTSWYPGF